jgi:hypothetical protein
MSEALTFLTRVHARQLERASVPRPATEQRLERQAILFNGRSSSLQICNLQDGARKHTYGVGDETKKKD